MKYNLICKFSPIDGTPGDSVVSSNLTLDEALKDAIMLTEAMCDDHDTEHLFIVVPDSIQKRSPSHSIGPVIPVMMSAADLDEQTWFGWIKSKIQFVEDMWEKFNIFGDLPKNGIPTPPDWWDARRYRSYQLAGYRCQQCGTDQEMLDAHHIDPRTKLRGDERDAEIEVLCRPCHMGRHPHWRTTYASRNGPVTQ